MLEDDNLEWVGERVRLVDPDEGRPLLEVVFDPERLVAELADQLGRLHAVPLAGCPTETSVDLLLDEARLRVEHGAVDPALFDEPYQRHSVDRLLEVASRMRPPQPDPTPVLVHGRATISSLRVLDDLSIGWQPSNRMGAGDPYRDLATISIDLAAKVSPQALGPFFDLYGSDEVDLARLDFHVLLDQLLR
jgi:aminoglycoside phosphotransferase